ncbi:MAG: sulfite dehydrogenase, partial [Acidocella sp.]|nr:sulfite dehydrogenase [Acidocella sp.]
MNEGISGMAKASRRKMFKFGAAAAGGALVAASTRVASAAVPAAPAGPLDDAWGHSLGAGVDDRPYGQPSKYEKDAIRRYVPWLAQSPQADASFTPLQDQPGIITANGFFFERYHAGRISVDPA